MRRGHGWRPIYLEVQRAMDAHRIPQQHIRNIDSGVYFTVQYHPVLSDVKGTLTILLPILYTVFCVLFSRHPVPSFCQPENLCQHLCWTKLQEPQKEVIQCKPCHDNRCQLSTTFISANCVTSACSGRTFHCCNQGANCNMKWAVYMIMCDVCGMQYVGQTCNISSRMNGYKSGYRRILNRDFSMSDTSALASVEHHGVQQTGCMDTNRSHLVASSVKAFSRRPTNSSSTLPRAVYLDVRSF